MQTKFKNKAENKNQTPNGFKKTDIGLIPEDWDTDELINHIGKPQYGFTDSASDKGNVQFLRITDITDYGVNWSKVPYCNCPREKIDNYRLTDNDIVFARIGATTGKSYLIKNPPKSIFASYLIRVQANNDLDAPFLYYFFNSVEYWKQINSNKGRNLKGGVNASLLSKLIMPLPPLPEQKKIAHILSKIQQAIETQEQIIKTTLELKKALMQKLFTEGLNGEPQKQSEIGLIPESWKVKSLEELTLKTNTRNPSREHPNKYIKYVDVSAISNEFFKIIDHQLVKGLEAPGRARKVIQSNDIIFATIRPTLKRIAKVSSDYNDEYCSTAFCVLRTNQKLLNEDYLYYYLQTDFFIEEIAKHQSGASYPAVRDDNVKDMMIPLPKISEQKQIAELFLELDKKLNLAFRRKAFATDLFLTTLEKLMTGQIRVKDIEFNIENNINTPIHRGGSKVQNKTKTVSTV